MTGAAVVARADALISLGRSSEAITLLSTALASEPDSAVLLRQMARAHLAAGRPEQARVIGERAVGADPNAEWGHRILSQAYSDLGIHPQAIGSADQAQRLAPWEWRTHVRRCLASAQAGYYGDALHAAEEAVRLAPEEADTHFALGYAAMKGGDDGTAERAYERALAIRPDHATALNNLGLIRMKQRGGLHKAVKGFGAALAADAQLTVAQRNLDVVAGRYMRRFHFGVVIAYFVLTASFNSPDSASQLVVSQHVSNASRVHAALVGAIALAILLATIVALDRRLPANLRRYYRRLPRTNLTLGAWLTVDLAALTLVCCLAVPTTYSGRSDLASIGWALIFLGLIISWLPRLRRRISRSRSA